MSKSHIFSSLQRISIPSKLLVIIKEKKKKKLNKKKWMNGVFSLVWDQSINQCHYEIDRKGIIKVRLFIWSKKKTLNLERKEKKKLRIRDEFKDNLLLFGTMLLLDFNLFIDWGIEQIRFSYSFSFIAF